MNFSSLTRRAKRAIDSAGGPDAIKEKAQRALDQAGGSEGVKAKAKDLRELSKSKGSVAEKAKSASEVVRREEPGSQGETPAASPADKPKTNRDA